MPAAFDFPGVQKVLDFSYTCSVGVSPGTIQVRALPANSVTAAGGVGPESAGPLRGDFRFSDGATGLTCRDCRLAPNGFRETSTSAGGRVWEFTLNDRRWRWAEGYAIDGDYNQLDDHAKLIPWTVRSPFQLAALLLDAMGEVGYAVDLPAGLSVAGASQGPGDIPVSPRADYLLLGTNAPATNTNPRTVWAGVPAAQALANLCAEYGRVVVYNPVGEQVSVQKIGLGSAPETGVAVSISPGVDPPRTPVAIVARGAPTRFQMRLAFRPVARDWDDSWQPLSEVSYAPAQVPQRMRVLCFSTIVVVNGVPFAGSYQQMADAINGSADPRVVLKVFAAVVLDGATGDPPTGGTPACLEVAGATPGDEFDIFGDGQLVCTAGPAAATPGFSACNPADFSTVVPTANLSYPQARERALSSVWRHYQLLAADPSDLTKMGIPIPGAGPNGRVYNRYLAVLLETRPEQVAPRPGDENRIDPATLQPYAESTYNGYSKDRAPACFGSLQISLGGGNYVYSAATPFGNSPKKSRFYVPFRVVDPLRQVIEFATPVYRLLGGAKAMNSTDAKLPSGATLGSATFLATDLVVETGVTLIDAATCSPARYSYTLPLGGDAPARTIQVPEAQLDVIGRYDAAHKLVGATSLDAYAVNAAANAAAATALTYATANALTVKYVGIRPVALSGLLRQVTWEMSPGGYFTTASANSEHSSVVLPYPARRRRENLTQDATRALQNLASKPNSINVARGFGGG